MDEAALPSAGGAPRSGRSARPRRRTSVIGVLGELLLTAGVVVMLYVVWQMWLGDLIYGARYTAEGSAISEEWAQSAPVPSDEPAPAPAEGADPAVAPASLPQPGSGELFGVMHIPRFGEDFAWSLRGGVGRSESLDIGAIGHYPDTAMPGDIGNFAVAAHRGSHGAAFMDLPALRVGDAVVIETETGWYTYRFRNTEYVAPDAVEVLLPVPQVQDVQANERYITMTTCSPRYGFSERLVAYGVFESFTPRDAGAPASLEPVQGA